MVKIIGTRAFATPAWWARLAAAFVFFCAPAPAQALQIDFAPLTGQSVYCDDLKIDLLITEDGDNVRFEFRNSSLVPSSIDALYFEKGLLNSLVGLDFEPGLLFMENARPARLPGGGDLVPVFQTAFSCRALPPVFHNGIAPGENLTVIFNLDEGATFEDLMLGLHAEEFRIGAHIIGLPDGSSLSAFNNTPEPSTILLLGAGSYILKKKRKICDFDKKTP